MIDDNNGIYTIDSGYGRENMAAVYIIVENGEAAIVETANSQSLERVIYSLMRLGLTSKDVKYIILTHIHLDHAGGAGRYMEEFATAKLIVHPKGKPHLVNPQKLEAGVTEVYGREFVARMYGRLIPISEERIIAAEDRFKLTFGNTRTLICRHTPGHANHHLAIFDDKAKVMFTGDVFGVSYPGLVNQSGVRFIFPTTTPVNFDPDLMHQSIDLICSYNPKAVYLTHFGALLNVNYCAKILHQMVDGYVNLALASEDSDDPVAEITQKLDQYMLEQSKLFGIAITEDEFQSLVGLDNQISAQGLAVWLNRRLKKL